MYALAKVLGDEEQQPSGYKKNLHWPHSPFGGLRVALHESHDSNAWNQDAAARARVFVQEMFGYNTRSFGSIWQW